MKITTNNFFTLSTLVTILVLSVSCGIPEKPSFTSELEAEVNSSFIPEGISAMRISESQDTIFCSASSTATFAHEEWGVVVFDYLLVSHAEMLSQANKKVLIGKLNFPEAGSNALTYSNTLDSGWLIDNAINPYRLRIYKHVLENWRAEDFFVEDLIIEKLIAESGIEKKVESHPSFAHQKITFARMIDGLILNSFQNDVDPEMKDLLRYLIDKMEQIDEPEKKDKYLKLLKICES
ncbi:MAG: hypothetical protein Salg2KO_16220 [Salibacteraceae bacterium]